MSKWSAVLEIPLPSPGPTGNGAALSVEQFDYIMFEVCGQFGALSMQIQATLDVTSGVWTPVGYDLNSDSTTITAAGIFGSFVPSAAAVRVHVASYTAGAQPLKVLLLGKSQ